MKNNTFKKILSAVLTVVILVSGICGSLIAANAAAAAFAGTTALSVGRAEGSHTVINNGLVQLPVTLTFKNETPFATGYFNYTATGDMSLAYTEATSVNATVVVSGTNASVTRTFTVRENPDNKGQVIFIPDNDTELYTSVSLTLNFMVEGGFKSATEYTLGVSVENGAIVDGYEDNTLSFSQSEVKFHAHGVADATATTCAACGKELGSQVAVEGKTFSQTIGVSGVNIRYNDNGLIEVNVHTYGIAKGDETSGIQAYGTDKQLIKWQSGAEAGTEKYPMGKEQQSDSYFAGSTLVAGAQMYTFGGLSAVDINKEIILVPIKGDTYGTAITFSLGEYCQKVVANDREVIYPASTSAEVIAADKDVYASMYYYGASANQYFANKNNPAPETSAPQKAPVWNGTAAASYESGTGTATDPYIIATPEQLYKMVSSEGGLQSDGTPAYFKVKDGVKEFYLSDIQDLVESGTATTDQILTAVGGSANQWNKFVGTTTSWTGEAWSPTAGGFKGNFNGNGATVYGMNAQGSSYKAGFIPLVNQSYNTVVSNISFKYSFVKMSSTADNNLHSAGVLFGDVSGDTNSQNTATVNNVEVSYAKTDDAVALHTYGGFIGTPRRMLFVAENCIAKSLSDKFAGFHATWGQYSNANTGQHQLTNCIAIDVSKGAAQYAQYSNCFTTSNSSTEGITNKSKANDFFEGTAAITNMTALDFHNVFAAVDGGYPELRVFHSFKNASFDDDCHANYCPDCKLIIADSKADHTLNATTEALECECGYKRTISGMTGVDSSIRSYLLGSDKYNKTYINSEMFAKANKDIADNNPTDASANMYFYGTSLGLNTNPYISFHFAFMPEIKPHRDNITASFAVDGETVASVTGGGMVNNQGAGRYHMYSLKELGIDKLCKPITVTVTYNNQTTEFGTYSVAGYAFKADAAQKQELAAAARALVYFSEMLAARKAVK